MYICSLSQSVFLSNLNNGKGVDFVYMHSQSNWTYPATNTIFFITQNYFYTKPHFITSGSSSSKQGIIETKTLSSPNTKNKFNIINNIDDKSRYFATPRKINYSATVPNANNNISDQVQFVNDTIQGQTNIKTNTTYQKLPRYGNFYLCFHTN